MAKFRKVNGKTKWIHLPVTPSTVLAEGSLVRFTSGKLVAAGAATAAADLVGVLRHGIAATDADYASDRLVEVEVPLEKHVVYEAEAVAAVASDVGVEVDLVDADTIDRSASAVKVTKVVRVLSTTKVLVWLKLNGSY